MDLTKDKISTLIRQIAIPSSIGTLFQTLYNIVDVKFAGLISPDAITAIAKSFPIYFIIIGFTTGLSIGVTALISNALGQKNEKKASTSFLQRKLQIGYNRAARIIDQMEENGVISKANHTGKREVL